MGIKFDEKRNMPKHPRNRVLPPLEFLLHEVYTGPATNSETGELLSVCEGLCVMLMAVNSDSMG